MIDYKFDISNNISFPSDSRKVMLLIDGDYYRMIVKKDLQFEMGDFSRFRSATINFELYKEEDSKNRIAYVNLVLNSSLTSLSRKFLKQIGSEEVPEDYFELKKIEVVDNDLKLKGIGTALLNYVLNDIKKFNELQGRNFKIAFLRIDDEPDITKPFYRKVGARENINVDRFSKYSTRNYTPMIIDEPKPTGEVPKELADNYPYSQNNEENPFTEPQRQ